MPKRIRLSQQQRSELVLRLLRQEASVAALAREAGISEATLYQWRDRFIAGGQQRLAPGQRGQAETTRLTQEITERDRIIGELTVANSVLKKSLGLAH